MPFTSSVFPVPSPPSSAMTSPASTTCPRRRPSSRVSSADAVSTKVFIPGSFEPLYPRAVSKPNPGLRVDLADHRQREIEALEETPGRGDARGGAGADQLEVLRVLYGQRPVFAIDAWRQ